MILLLKNLLFTLLVPGTVAVYVPLFIARGRSITSQPLLLIAVHTFVVRYEEPKLHALFGAEYDAYAAHVGRWLPRRDG